MLAAIATVPGHPPYYTVTVSWLSLSVHLDPPIKPRTEQVWLLPLNKEGSQVTQRKGDLLKIAEPDRRAEISVVCTPS